MIFPLVRRLAGDGPTRIFVAVYGLALGVVGLTMLWPAASLTIWALEGLDPVLEAVILGALVWGRRARRGWRQRRFWDLLALAWLCRLLVDALFFFEAILPLVSPSFAADLLYVLFYLSYALAIELRPHLAPEPAARLARRRLEGSAGLVAVFGLLVYFALIVLPEPAGVSLIFVSQEQSLIPYLLMRLSLDVLLFGRALFPAFGCRDRWRAIYTLLAASFLCFAVRDLALVLQAADFADSGRLGLGWQAFLLLPGFLVILAARASRIAVEDDPGKVNGAVEVAREDVLRASPLALYMLIVPVIHLLLYPLDLLDAASRGARDVFSLLYLVVVGLLAARHQKVLESERRDAMDSLEKEVDRRERIHRELELRHSELEQFTYTISHELRSPLVTIHGFTSLLERDFCGEGGEDEAATGHLGRIRDATSDMNRLLTELLELSRVGWVLERRPGVSLTRIAEKVCSRLAIGVDEATAPQIVIERDMPRVDADPARLEDLLSNLVTNAIKFTPAGERPRIHIGVRPGDPPVFFVADRGRGIPVESQDRVFGLFDRLDHPEIEGTGVGLALVKRIVEKHGGRVWVESDGLGTGATFCFTLPPAPEVEPDR